MKRKSVAIITFTIILAMIVSSTSVFAGYKLAKGWADIDGVTKNGKTIKTRTIHGQLAFNVYYHADKKGVYTAYLWELDNNHKKKQCVKTFNISCTQKCKVKGKVRYKGNATFVGAKKNKWYCLFPKTTNHNPSYNGKTKK